MGLCPECLMKAGFPTGSQPAAAATGGGFEPPPVAEIARLFPQLEILGFLGKGGMGAVYKARQPALDRLVAIKVLPPTVANDPGFAERFNREARALARLSHPNIVAVHDFGQAGPLHYLVMELVDGTNLRELERAGRLSPEQALAIVPQICAALEFAHGEGIVHRDIKPENLLIDKKGRLKITDFGIAKVLGAAPDKITLTGVKDVMGTPHYMAPEQIERPQTVDHRADIYSLGVVFYEMLTGELPLGKFEPPSQKVQMDVRLDEVVLRTLEKEPGRRYQRAGEIKTRVETIASTPPSVPGSGGQVPHAPAATPVSHVPLAASPALSDKTILPGFLLGFFFGVFGAHRFYVGKFKTAVAQLALVLMWIPMIVAIVADDGRNEPFLGLTLAALILGSLVWATIDCILILCKAFTDGQGRRMTNWVNPGPGGTPSIPLSQPAPGAPMSVGTFGDNKGIIIAPAIGLMLASGYNILKAMMGLFLLNPVNGLVHSILSGTGLENALPISAMGSAGIFFFALIPAAVTLYGAIEMLQVRHYGWAVAAAVASILSCGILGTAIGLWALIVLLSEKVRRTFASQPTPRPPSLVKWPWVIGGTTVVGVVLVLLSLLVPRHRSGGSPIRFFNALNRLPEMGDTVASAVDASMDSLDAADPQIDAVSSGNAIQVGDATSFTQSFSVGPTGKLTIRADRGDIQVETSDEKNVNVEITREVKRASDATATKILKEEHVLIRHDGNNVAVTSLEPETLRHGWWWSRPELEARYNITVPHGFAAHLTTLGGEIEVDGAQGSVFAHTAGGELKFDELAGPLDAHTLGGGITIDRFSGPSVLARTSGGDIDADFISAPQSDSQFHTMGGTVTVKLPASSKITLDAHTLGGSVSCELPVEDDGPHKDGWLRGTINGGGPQLKLESLGGDVQVHAR